MRKKIRYEQKVFTGKLLKMKPVEKIEKLKLDSWQVMNDRRQLKVYGLLTGMNLMSTW